MNHSSLTISIYLVIAEYGISSLAEDMYGYEISESLIFSRSLSLSSMSMSFSKSLRFKVLATYSFDSLDSKALI
jgi:hypothetical protein